MGNIHTVGPNKALIISGGCGNSKNVKIIVGGWGWAWWCVTDVQKISLGVMTLIPECRDVETAEGVPLTVTGVAQVKVIISRPELLRAACEQFLGKSRAEMKNTILQTLEGHLRAILGTLTVEGIYQDRDSFARLVREMASPDIGKMGIEILSFTIRDIFDNVEYLNSLGRAQTAVVKRDADIGVAEAERDAGIREAAAEKLRMDARYQADTAIADSRRGLSMQRAGFDAEVSRARAEAELAYSLQAAREQQLIRGEEIQIEVVERRKQIEIEEREVQRNERELDATVKRPADAEAFRRQVIAEGNRVKRILGSQAEAEAIRLHGQATADSTAALGKAEAEGMRLRAEAYKEYGEAATLQLVLDTLPKLAAEVTAPLAKTKEILILGDNSTSKETCRLLGSLPPAVKTLTGVDLSGVLAGMFPGSKSSLEANKSLAVAVT